MQTTTRSAGVTDISAIDVRVDGPEVPLEPADLRRLFPGSALTEGRLDRLRTWPRVVAICSGQIVGLATCQKSDAELRVPEIGIDSNGDCGDRDVMTVVLDALELAGLAAGCRRIVVLPPRVAASCFERRGYTTISERCAGAWLEKALL